jgi:hypothetical protein
MVIGFPSNGVKIYKWSEFIESGVDMKIGFPSMDDVPYTAGTPLQFGCPHRNCSPVDLASTIP